MSTMLAFDFGTRRIGAAVGQAVTCTARPLPAVKAREGKPDWQAIARLLQEWRPDQLIVGLPLNMDGSDQSITAQARKFARQLQGRFGLKTILHDERLTTVEARGELFDQGGFRALEKGKVDSLSAVVILESYLRG